MHLCNIQRRKEDRNLARRIKYIEGKSRKPGTTLVTLQKIDDSTLEITDKIPPVNIIIAEQIKVFHQTKAALPLLDDPWLYLDIGYLGEGSLVEAIIYGKYVCP